MRDKQSASNCRWATPTLFVSAHTWYLADEYPWTCLRDGIPKPLPDTGACETCARWEPDASPASTVPRATPDLTD
jgi:hypothetical protein